NRVWPTENAQRSTSNVEISSREPNVMATCVYADRTAHRCSRVDHFFAPGKLASAHCAAKHRRTRETGERGARCLHRRRALAATHYHQQPRLHGTNYARKRVGRPFKTHRSRTRTAPYLGRQLEAREITWHFQRQSRIRSAAESLDRHSPRRNYCSAPTRSNSRC